MEKKVLNYKILIEKEKTEGKKGYVFNAHCPSLGLSDYGKTIDEALQRMKDLIKFHLESLSELGEEIPLEREITTVITSVEVPFRLHGKFSYV